MSCCPLSCFKHKTTSPTNSPRAQTSASASATDPLLKTSSSKSNHATSLYGSGSTSSSSLFHPPLTGQDLTPPVGQAMNLESASTAKIPRPKEKEESESHYHLYLFEFFSRINMPLTYGKGDKPKPFHEAARDNSADWETGTRLSIKRSHSKILIDFAHLDEEEKLDNTETKEARNLALKSKEEALQRHHKRSQSLHEVLQTMRKNFTKKRPELAGKSRQEHYEEQVAHFLKALKLPEQTPLFVQSIRQSERSLFGDDGGTAEYGSVLNPEVVQALVNHYGFERDE